MGFSGFAEERVFSSSILIKLKMLATEGVFICIYLTIVVLVYSLVLKSSLNIL